MTKTAYCGCCKHWVEHMKKAGFQVQVREVEDVAPTRARLGVPDALRSCHTSEIGGYAIEGHVPAADVKRLLATKPKAAGIAVSRNGDGIARHGAWRPQGALSGRPVRQGREDEGLRFALDKRSPPPILASASSASPSASAGVRPLFAATLKL